MLAESAILVGVALALVVPFTGLIASALSSRFGVSIPMPDISRIDYWLGVGAIAMVAAILAGAYPALALANLRPTFAMRITGLSGGTGVFRALLIGVQFTAAGFLLVVMTVMLMQNSNLRHEMLRSDTDPVVVMPLLSDMAPSNNPADRMENIRQRLLASPAVRSVSYSQLSPFAPNTDAELLEFTQSFDPSARRFVSQARRVYFDYFETVGAKLIADRAFSRDENDSLAVVIDAATAARMGYTPHLAVGQVIRPLTVPGSDQVVNEANAPELRIIGVVEREPLELMAEGPLNYVYVGGPLRANYALIQISADNIDRALQDIKQVWSDLGDLRGFEPQLLDEVFETSYRGFAMITVVTTVLSGIAANISAMGLFGMASFVVQRRLREIGVRKALGASVPRVAGLMLWDFSRPVIVANLIAWPLAFVVARFYLNLFVTRIELTPLPFVLALTISLLIACMAVSLQALRGAIVKPAVVLKGNRRKARPSTKSASGPHRHDHL